MATGAVLLTTAFFLLFSFMRKRKLGIILYFALAIIVIPCVIWILSMSKSTLYYYQWFFSPQSSNTASVPYSAGTMVMFAFMLSSIVFYYTNIVFRRSMLFLALIIPMAIYAKRLDSVPTAIFVLVALSYILICIYSPDDNVKTLKDGRFYAGSMIFAGVVVLIAAIIPKPELITFREQFDEFTNGIGQTVNVLDTYGKFTKNTDGSYYGQPSDTVLFYVKSDAPVYLKRQTFSEYKGGKVWSIIGDSNYISGETDWRYAAKGKGFETLTSQTELLGGSGISKGSVFAPGTNERVVTVYPSDFVMDYILSVNNTYDISGFAASKRLYKSDVGDFYADENSIDSQHVNYSILYYSEVIDEGDPAFNFVRTMNPKRFEALYGTVLPNVSELDFTDSEYYLYKEYENAYKYYYDTYTEPSAQIKQLSDEICAGSDSDYDKAKAIEKYFAYSGNFVYDADYRPSDDSPEFFIFSSKRGKCTDYATSVALLARAAGLPTRYVTGFLAQQPVDGEFESDDGTMFYEVKDSNAHAFCEIYICGYGWMTIDGTPPSFSEVEEEQDTKFDFRPLLTLLGIMAGVIILTAVIILTFPMLSEMFFRLSISTAKPEKGITALYKRLRKRIAPLTEVSVSSLSPRELSSLVLEKVHIDASPICDAEERFAFGGETPGKDEMKRAVQAYKEITATIRKMKRRRKNRA